jgi:hypothetical protein
MRHSAIAGRRPLAGLVLLLQLTALGAWLPHFQSDARVTVGTHVEAAGTSDCSSAHDENRCRLCQSVTVRLVVPSTGTPHLPLGVLARGSADAVDSRMVRGAFLARCARAPPRSVV